MNLFSVRVFFELVCVCSSIVQLEAIIFLPFLQIVSCVFFYQGVYRPFKLLKSLDLCWQQDTEQLKLLNMVELEYFRW